ncbi:MAG: MazG family protein, partial [Verrucomicrobiota bacterium]
HPHVYGESDVETTDGVLRQWDEIKAEEKGGTPKKYLDKVGEGFPGLLRAKEIQKQVAKVGFDWDNSEDVIAKVREEFAEVETELESGNRQLLGEEIGDLLFSIVNLARKEGMCAESLLAATNEKFIDRFHKVESGLNGEGKSLEDATLEEMDAAWERAKGKK